jgi:hypothetical protein
MALKSHTSYTELIWTPMINRQINMDTQVKSNLLHVLPLLAIKVFICFKASFCFARFKADLLWVSKLNNLRSTTLLLDAQQLYVCCVLLDF